LNVVTSGNFNNATLISILKNHITNEVTHYKGKCLQWDVVNEALEEDGTFRKSVFYNTIGPAFIPIAFAAAAAADPSAKLYYNDYNIENAGGKSTGAQNIVKMIKQYGARIDGVGFQAHFIVGSTPSQAALTANLNAFVDLGVEVAYTELDIRTNTPATSSAVTQQAKDYVSTVNSCNAVAKCVGITIWDYTDKYSWIPGVFPGTGSALPWDNNLNKKTTVYNAILSALGPAPSGTAPPTSTAPVSSAPVSSTPAPSATPTLSPAPGNVPKWQQCGGNGYTGATDCVSGCTCTKLNDFYWQCL
jgi:endo-1,4-beta-xylanase